ncbi:MAG: hypothetical protein ACLFQV_09585 [Vulcanimicrobiota bacterium]
MNETKLKKETGNINNYVKEAEDKLEQALLSARAGLFEDSDRYLEQSNQAVEKGNIVVNQLAKENPDEPVSFMFVNGMGRLNRVSGMLKMASEIIFLYKKLNKDFLHFG